MTVDTTRLRLRLDSWQFWVGVAYFGLALVIVALWVVFSRQSDEAARRAVQQQEAASALKASNISQVNGCITAAQNRPIVFGFINGQAAIINSQILSTSQALALTSADDPLYLVREKALTRLNSAANNNKALKELIIKTTPTLKQCKDLANKLHVDYPIKGKTR